MIKHIIVGVDDSATAAHAARVAADLARRLGAQLHVIMACDDEIIPSQMRIESAADEVDLAEIYDTERHLLYVACTRARDQLHVSAVSPASEFLGDLESGAG